VTPRAISKRVLDIAGSASAIVVLAPVLGAIAMLVARDIGRPVLFKQRRPGRGGRSFTMFKFRTMREPGPGESRFLSDANRLTALGAFLRKSSLDELPELLNVLRGEMSIVGPRPLLESYLSKYSAEQARRHDVRPGITGWAQVNGRQHIPFSKRLELDVWYVDNHSLGLDITILLKTIRLALFGDGVESGQSLADVDDLGFFTTEEKDAQGG